MYTIVFEDNIRVTVRDIFQLVVMHENGEFIDSSWEEIDFKQFSFKDSFDIKGIDGDGKVFYFNPSEIKYICEK